MTKSRGYPNETLQLLYERASCRSFSDEKIPADVLQAVLEAGIHAPTGGNLQPYSIIKIEKEQARAQLAQYCGEQAFVAKAPVDLLFCMDWRRLERWAEFEIAPFTSAASFKNFWISFQDTVLCAHSICMAADSVGLASVYVGTVLDRIVEIRDLFGLPKRVFPVVVLCLGYPTSRTRPARKLGVDVIVHDETYREMADADLADAFDEKYRGRERQVTDERIEKVFQVCKEVHGEAFAQRCVERIRDNGLISAVQTYFGLHYCANELPKGNEIFVKRMEEFGFDWFNEYRPPSPQ